MWTNPGFLPSIIAFIDTKNWIYEGVGHDFTMFNVRESVDSLVTKFRNPLGAKGASLSSAQD